MDALAGYGSDSSAEENKPATPAGALSGLLADYSDDDDDDAKDTGGAKGAISDDHGETPASKKNKDNGLIKGADQEKDTPAQKRRRRWDNPNNNDASDESMVHVLPPPRLSTIGNDIKNEVDPFQSLQLFPKDYTTKLRQTLSQQMKSQTNNPSDEHKKLSQKLDQMYQSIQKQNNTTKSSASSFASHLKSKHEFGNPHLLKNIIDHFQINPLESHVGNKFGNFEYVDRLMVAEEKSRIAAANFSAGVGSGGASGI